MGLSDYGLDLKVNVPLLQDSLKELADVVCFIATGCADDINDSDAWDRRVIGGLCAYRVKKMLSFGDLSEAACELKTVRRLENIWSLIKLLQHGCDTDNSDEYKGPLFLPGEHDTRGRLRKVDEQYISFEDLGIRVPEKCRTQLTRTKAKAWSWYPNELLSHAWRLDPSNEQIKPKFEVAVANPSDTLNQRSQQDDPDSDEILGGGECLIELEYRTRAMTKLEAARHLGFERSEWKNLARRVTAEMEAIEKKEQTVVMWPLTPQRWIFDYRVFPKSEREKVR